MGTKKQGRTKGRNAGRTPRAPRRPTEADGAVAPKTPADEPPTRKQPHLPGMAPASFPEIEEAAEKYRLLRNERMALGKQELDARRALEERMRERSVTEYRFEDQLVVIERIEKAKVRTVTDETAPTEDAEADVAE